MKLNREKTAALIALVIASIGFKGVIVGFITPVRGISVPDVVIRGSAREVLPRKHRTYTEESEPARNPFSFSEGWQQMEPPPMAPPPLPPLPIAVPALGPGPTPLEAGFLYQDRPAPEAQGEEGQG